MKFRSGFVSNSSSSSFIMFLPKKINSESDISELIIKNKSNDDILFSEANNDISKQDVVEYVFSSIEYCDLKFIENNIYKLIAEDGFLEYCNCIFFNYWETLEILKPIMVQCFLEKIHKDHPSDFMYRLNVGDEYGQIGSFLEYTDIFDEYDPFVYSYQ